MDFDGKTCPFCSAELSDPGEGFMTHLDESEPCKVEWLQWAGHVAEDSPV